MMFRQLDPSASLRARALSPCVASGSYWDSRRRSIAVWKTPQHWSHTSKLRGPGNSWRTHIPEATLKEKAT
eukprot:6647866-Alexandrium_andersonii.AAC.1